MKRSLSAAPAFFFLIALLSAPPLAAEETAIYKNSRFRYRVACPAAWSLREWKQEIFNPNVTIRADIIPPGNWSGDESMLCGLSIEAVPCLAGARGMDISEERGVSFLYPDYPEVTYGAGGYRLPLLDRRYGASPVIMLALSGPEELEAMGLSRDERAALDEAGLAERLFFTSSDAERAAPPERVTLIGAVWRKEQIRINGMLGVIVFRCVGNHVIATGIVGKEHPALGYAPVWITFLDSLGIDVDKWISSTGHYGR